MDTTSPEELKEQLDGILIRVAKVENIENFEIFTDTEANYGDGFVGQFYKGDVRNKDTGEVINVAIKKAPTWEFDYNTIFKNEYLFYSESYPVLDKLQKESQISEMFHHVPKYLCGSLEPKKEYIAMEHLKPFGYVMFDKKQYLDKDHIETIFKVYGKFHALSFVLRAKDLERYQKITKDFTDITAMMAKYIYKPMISALGAAVDALDPEKDKILYDQVQDLPKNIVPTFLKACTYEGDHRCLIHGDCWSNNMLFKYSDNGKLEDIKLLDFQLAKDGSPIHDLSYFFYSGASKEDFDELEEYLQIYYQSFIDFSKELGASSEEILSFEKLKSEWRDNSIFGVVMAIYLWQIKLTPKKDFTDIMDSAKEKKDEKPSVEETWQQWNKLLEEVHKSDMYKERTTAILRHAFEYGVLNKDKIINKE